MGRAILGRHHAQVRKNRRHGDLDFLRYAVDSTARLPPQSPVPFPYHRDLSGNGDFLGKAAMRAFAGTGQRLHSGRPVTAHQIVHS